MGKEISRIRLNRLSNLFDVYGNRCNITDRFHIPYFTEQFLFCKYMIWILCQKSQQIKLFCRKLFLFSIDPYPARRLVYFNAPDLNEDRKSVV